MKIISWNVNGFRAFLEKKEAIDFIDKFNSDFFCLQEIKIDKDEINKNFCNKLKKFNNKEISFLKKYNHFFWNSAERKGYSGTAIFTKEKPIDIVYGIGDELDNEGRAITLEFKNFFLINVYVPNSKPDLSRLDYRYNKWDKNLLSFLKKLKEKKEVILCGDLNVAHQEIDLKNPLSNKTTATKPGNAGFTDKERKRFSDFLKNNFIDIYRELYPKKIKYSWWSYRFNARKNNSGWRIDYFLISKNLKDKIKKVEIYDEVAGSDHCPIGLEINK